MSESDYISLKARGKKLKGQAEYDVSKGEMDPAIFEEFAGVVLGRKTPRVIWEPFAGHTRRSRTQDFAARTGGLKVVSFDVAPCDERVRRADSTVEGPGGAVGGVLFHPPYYGSRPLSLAREDVSFLEWEWEYRKALAATARFAAGSLVLGGLVCAVGRDYRFARRRVRLDLWYLEMFESDGMVLVDVWTSEPDVAMVFETRRRPCIE